MNATTIQNRVKRGAEWLDEIKPLWHKEIDLKRFTMTNARLCVCGQLDRNGGFYHFVKEYKLRVRRQEALGFWVDYKQFNQTNWYKVLEEEWRRLIKERQTKAK